MLHHAVLHRSSSKQGTLINSILTVRSIGNLQKTYLPPLFASQALGLRRSSCHPCWRSVLHIYIYIYRPYYMTYITPMIHYLLIGKNLIFLIQAASRGPTRLEPRFRLPFYQADIHHTCHPFGCHLSLFHGKSGVKKALSRSRLVGHPADADTDTPGWFCARLGNSVVSFRGGGTCCLQLSW